MVYAQRTTDNDCFEQEDAEFESSCRSLFYPMCDSFNILPKGTCNVVTFGSTAMTWYSQDLSVNFWSFITKLVPPPPPPPAPPSPEEKKEIIAEAKAEGKPPPEENEWAEWNWLEKKEEEDPCAKRTDCEWKCVPGSDIPSDYTKNKDLTA